MMLEFLKAIDQNLMFASLLLLMLGLVKFKRCNSFVLSLLLIFIYDLLSREIVDVFLDWTMNSFEGEYRYMVWFSFWLFMDMLFAVVLLALHSHLTLPFSDVANALTNACIARCILHITIYANMLWLEWGAIDRVYNYGIPAINIGTLILIGYFLARSLKDDRATTLFYYG